MHAKLSSFLLFGSLSCYILIDSGIVLPLFWWILICIVFSCCSYFLVMFRLDMALLLLWSLKTMCTTYEVLDTFPFLNKEHIRDSLGYVTITVGQLHPHCFGFTPKKEKISIRFFQIFYLEKYGQVTSVNLYLSYFSLRFLCN